MSAPAPQGRAAEGAAEPGHRRGAAGSRGVPRSNSQGRLQSCQFPVFPVSHISHFAYLCPTCVDRDTRRTPSVLSPSGPETESGECEGRGLRAAVETLLFPLTPLTSHPESPYLPDPPLSPLLTSLFLNSFLSLSVEMTSQQSTCHFWANFWALLRPDGHFSAHGGHHWPGRGTCWRQGFHRPIPRASSPVECAG